MNRLTAVVIAALIAALAAVGVLFGSNSEDHAGPRDSSGPSIASIARGVERVRELRFERLPPVRRVTGAQARAAGLGELDREIPRRALVAEERLLKLLGLLPADGDLRELTGEALGSQVGGYYVPRTGTLSIVSGFGEGLTREITLAHELTHALEDQRFGIDPRPWDSFERDRSVAAAALREGTATIAMVDYVVRQQAGDIAVPARLRARALTALDDAAVPESSGLPRYLREQLVFPYVAGARLVNRIQGRGGWAAVNRTFGADAPISSEQVMHPAKYDAHERPVRVRAPAAGPAGARLAERGDFGEFDTEQLLRAANGRTRSEAAAAGWGGGAFSLWRLGADRYAVALHWVWDSARDAREFERAVRRTARRLGGATVKSSGKAVELQLAPRA